MIGTYNHIRLYVRLVYTFAYLSHDLDLRLTSTINRTTLIESSQPIF